MGSTMLGEQDVYLFREGTHGRLYASWAASSAATAATFRVWAPNAARVSVIGVFNGWDAAAHPLVPRADDSGIWEGTVAGVEHGDAYKFRVVTARGRCEWTRPIPSRYSPKPPPSTASRAWTLDYDWDDSAWMAARSARNALDAPDVDLRGAPRVLAPRRRPPADVSRDRAAACRLRARSGLHARRVPAGDRASVLRLVGLPDDRLLRADGALRNAAGFHAPRRRPAPTAASA